MSRIHQQQPVSCVRCGYCHTPRRQLKGRQSQVCWNTKACRKRQEKRRRYALRTVS